MKPVSILVLGSELENTKIKSKLSSLEDNKAVTIGFSNIIESFSHDIYVISQKFLDSYSPVDSIRKNRRGSKIFAVCDMRNSIILRNLLDMDIDGYINIEDYEIDSLIEAVNSSLDFRTKADKIEQKVRVLSMCNDRFLSDHNEI